MKARFVWLGVILAVVAATTVNADIMVSWQSSDYMWLDLNDNNVADYGDNEYLNGGSATETVPSYHALLWSSVALSSDPGVTADVSSSDAAGTSYTYGWGTEYLLYGATSTSFGRFNVSGGSVSAYPSMLFDDADVGGNDINSGYLYTRIFSDTSVEVGTGYYQSAAAAPSGWVVGGSPAEQVLTEIDATPEADYPGTEYALTVVPEPATMALFAMGLVTLAIRRRKD